MFYGDGMRWWYGVVVDTDGSGGVASDPLQLGRALVRITGLHDDPIKVPDEKLPWAAVIVPVTEGGIDGIGTNPGLKPRARVVGFFLDGEFSQIPVIWGSIPHIQGEVSSRISTRTQGLRGSPDQGGAGHVIPTDGTGDRTRIEGYGEGMTRGEIESWIREEAELRGIDPEIAVIIFREEGAGGYQSSVPRAAERGGSRGGFEASYGPFQLFVGGGLGNEYEDLTGRNLVEDNTREGVLTQIRFALDRAVEQGWTPWYGRLNANVGGGIQRDIAPREGLDGARTVGNWR